MPRRLAKPLILCLLGLLCASSLAWATAHAVKAIGGHHAQKQHAKHHRRHKRHRKHKHHRKHKRHHRHGTKGDRTARHTQTSHTTAPGVPTHPATAPTPPGPPAQPAIGPRDVIVPFPTAQHLFAPTSFWNAALPANVALDPRSAQLSSAFRGEIQKEVTGNYGPWINTTQYSVSDYTVGSATPTMHVTLDAPYPDVQRDFDSVPIPTGAHVAPGKDGSLGDGQLVIYQPSTDTLWEFWLLQLRADGWHAAWGGKMTSVSTNPGYFNGNLGATGTSLPLLGGLMTIRELQAGRIDHALAAALPNTAAGTFTWPAQRGDGRTTGPTAVPEGTHFRIDPSIDLTKLNLSPTGLVIARAAQKYGFVVRDTGGCFVFYAEDPVATGGDPYGQIFDGKYPSQVLQNFPWDRLQVVAPGHN